MVNDDNPPPYDDSLVHVTPCLTKVASEPSGHESEHCDVDSFNESYEERVPLMQAGPSYLPSSPTPAMHHYVNPVTGEQVISPLPPSHPEMICLQEGTHVRRTRFGLLGVLAAVFWFPLGVGLCLLDRRVTCDRCGRTIEDGILCG